MQTPVPNLYFMPSGITPADSAGLLNSKRFTDLLADAKGRFDLVLICQSAYYFDPHQLPLLVRQAFGLVAAGGSLVIAHRLSTVRRANLILLMEDGRIIERGTHEQLMDAKGTYHDMVVRQMASHEEAWS